MTASDAPLIVDLASSLNGNRRCSNGEKDDTYYWETKKFREHSPHEELSKRVEKYTEAMNTTHKRALRGEKGRSSRIALEETVEVIHGGRALGSARASICLCNRGLLLSVTIRGVDASKLDESKPDDSKVPNTPTNWASSTPLDGALVSNHRLATVLLDTVKYTDNLKLLLPSGLIVIAGSTKSGKSHAARALTLEAILRSVKRCSEGDKLKAKHRLPHLVTIEDPIEDEWRIGPEKTGVELLFKPGKSPLPTLDFGFCFTPRQIGVDVRTLSDGLADAKRQTPACMYIGEVRHAKDWSSIIEFAGSGHLVIATTHASRLTEMFSRILRATGAHTSADRRNIGAQLLACVHTDLPSIPGHGNVLMPSAWLRTSESLAGLVADGLSSIVPNNCSIWSREQLHSKLIEGSPKSDVLNHARRLDIQGFSI